MAKAEEKGLTRRSMLGTTAVAAVAGAAGAAGFGVARYPGMTKAEAQPAPPAPQVHTLPTKWRQAS